MECVVLYQLPQYGMYQLPQLLSVTITRALLDGTVENVQEHTEVLHLDALDTPQGPSEQCCDL